MVVKVKNPYTLTKNISFMLPSPQRLSLPSGDYIAYHQLKGKPNQPGIIFLGGFMSDMTGTKATTLEEFCLQHSYSFIRFDYMGHGQSSGSFTQGTIGLWKENALHVLDHLTVGPQILIGSSMGGWLMLLAALSRPKRIHALIGIASAPDFTENLIWDVMSGAQQAQLLQEGIFDLASDYADRPYPITRQLIEEGRNHLVLQSPIPIHVPVHLFHGLQDQDVPAIISQKLYDSLLSNDKYFTPVEDGDHRLSSPSDMERIFQLLQKLIETT
jgi:pimeloyl-ACP methyl ester carboxylesterase